MTFCSFFFLDISLTLYWFDSNNHLCPAVQIFKSVSFSVSLQYLIFLPVFAAFIPQVYFLSLVRLKQDKSNSIPVIRQSLYFCLQISSLCRSCDSLFLFSGSTIGRQTSYFQAISVPRKCITSHNCTEVESLINIQKPISGRVGNKLGYSNCMEYKAHY